MVDIYFDENYGKLYEEIEKGICEVFEFKNSYGEIYHMFIKREIPIRIKGEIYYDLVTPNGYGGPLIVRYEEEFKDELIKGFEKEFQYYCEINNIVSEFVRFHPMVNNAEDFKEIYKVTHIRNTIGTNLADFENPFKEEFTKSCRKNVKKALNQDISYRITESPEDVNIFKNIYYSTMNRNEASDYYYFDDHYFEQCLEYFKENLLIVEAIYQEKTIAMGFYFIYDNTIHIHLSGTLSEYLHLSPAYVLRYAVTEWGKENGYSLIHHGGGRTNDQNDTLYTFKKQFGKNTEFKFFVGKKIWNLNVYNQLCNEVGTTSNYEFFPSYRNSSI